MDKLPYSEAKGTQKSKLIRRLYDSSIHIAINRENQLMQQAGKLANLDFDTNHAIQLKAQHIQRLCPTMFTQSQTTTFVGQSILH